MSEDTIAAVATAPGPAALGVVRVSGPDARAVARRILGEGDLEPRRASARAAKDASGNALDRVVAVLYPGPATATGEDLLEIAAHGSPAVLDALLAAALAAGARPAAPGEFTRRAFVNGRLDLAQAEAVLDLIAARGERTRREALARLEGGLSRAVAAARAPILALLVELEARLDHPDEDLAPLAPEDYARRLGESRVALARLLAGAERARVRDGARVVLVGRPNAGKSSLLNALLGRERAIVSERPGTTRDLLEETASCAGVETVLVDTAGLRADAEDPAEREGVARAEGALASCDAAVLVVDAARAPDAADEDARRRVLELASRGGRPVLVALNKADLVNDRAALCGGLAVSAVTGEGLEELVRAVARAAGGAPKDEEGESFAAGARARTALAAALVELDAAAGLPAGQEELAAARLRAANSLLGEVLGEGAPDEVLDQLFARFCVGK